MRVAPEATADFHRPIAHWLLRKGFEVIVASSITGAWVKEVLFGSWEKHGGKDALGTRECSCINANSVRPLRKNPQPPRQGFGNRILERKDQQLVSPWKM